MFGEFLKLILKLLRFMISLEIHCFRYKKWVHKILTIFQVKKWHKCIIASTLRLIGDNNKNYTEIRNQVLFHDIDLL